MLDEDRWQSKHQPSAVYHAHMLASKIAPLFPFHAPSGPLVTPLAFVEHEYADGEVVGDCKLHCRPEHVVVLVLCLAAFCVCLPTRRAWGQRSNPRPSPPTTQ